MVLPGTKLAIGMVLAALLAACARDLPQCDACGRRECGNMSTTIVRTDGKRERTCCPRCAVHALRTGPPAQSVTVRDFDTGRPLSVADAVFVEGSDVHPCRGVVETPPGDERGCCLTPAYDRCEPSVVAFSSTEAAARFMDAHGGLATTWTALEAAHEPG